MISSALRKIIKQGRQRELTWRYVFNLAPTLAYRFTRQSLVNEADRVLADLNRNGVAITSVEALLGVNPCYDELSSAVDGLEAGWLSAQLDGARAEANHCAIGNKTFIFHLLGENPPLDPASVYARFALQSPILQIANRYFGMFTRLRYYNIWHNFTTRTEARESQLWHYDREDYFILKMFVYLSDVNENCGPFTYAPGTHRKAKLQGEPESFVEGGVKRSDDQQMSRFLPQKDWVQCTGAKGTIVFADTRGYHKGGLAREHDRIMYTCMFTSKASQSQEFLHRTISFPQPENKELAFALSTPGVAAPVKQAAKSL
jgi:hypothetical protein